MVASTGPILKGGVVVPPEVDTLIGEALLAFVKDRGWGSESFDLHYHDEPIWYVRRDVDGDDSGEGHPEKTVRTTRVQLAAFVVSGEAQLVVMPDAYDYVSNGQRIKHKATETARREGRLTLPLRELEFWLAEGDRSRALGEVRGMVETAWTTAQTMQLRRVR